MSAPPSVYLAGPDVFLPDSVAVGRRKQAICRAQGLEGHSLFGRGYPVWGYTSHAADYAARVLDDGDQLVEAFGLADNLMLEGPMLRRDHSIVRVPESGPNAAAAFDAFEVVVRHAAAELL